MKIKQRPDDFRVTESWRFDGVDSGRYRVYLMDKRKLSTFDAVERVRERFGLKPGAISYCGLKDKQGRTEQIIAVDSDRVIELQEPDLRLRLLGRTDKPLSAANTTSNRFSVTVRALQPDDLRQLTVSTAEVGRLGVVNYFDSQRFGSLKHGQGFIAKDLIRGDFEAALRNYMAQPSPLDRSDDVKIKRFWKENWGQWDKNPYLPGNNKYYRILKVLRDRPKDFVDAFLQIDKNYRALLLFTYQSYLWNEGVRRLLQLMLPREQLFPMPYQAGTLLFHRDASPDVLKELRHLTFPLLAANSEFTHPKVKEAAEWVLGKEKLKLEDLRIEEAARMLFFKHEERPVLVWPDKLVLGRPLRDELNAGFNKLNVAFTLPPGSYATLVVKRLFHFAWLGDTHEEPTGRTEPYSKPWGDEDDRPSRPSRPAKPEAELKVQAPQRERAPREASRDVRDRGRGRARDEGDDLPEMTIEVERPGRRPPPREASSRTPTKAPKASPAPAAAPEPKVGPAEGFRAMQKRKKAHRVQARTEQAAKAPARKGANSKKKSAAKRPGKRGR